MLKIISSALVLGALISCMGTPVETPGISYTKSTPIGLNVSSIQVVVIPEVHPVRSEEAKHESKLLQDEAEKWGKSRFMAQGGEDKALITISKVHCKQLADAEKEMPSDIAREFYDGRLKVKIDIIDARGFVKGSVMSSVDKTLGIPVAYTSYEKDAELKLLREEIINATDAKVIKDISQNLMMYMVM